ncbi:30592_t:CDS:2, partial [Gigaspora margarita]
FWSNIDASSLRKFLDFRHLEGELADPDTEHYRYQSELNTISKYYIEGSEVGQKVLKLKSDLRWNACTDYFVGGMLAKERWNALSVVVFGWKAHMDNLWVECSQEKVECSSIAVEVNKTLWNLRNICIESEFADEKSKLQWKEGMLEFEKTGLRHLQETSSAVQEKQILSYTSYVSSETQTNNVHGKVNICTPKRTITSEDKEASENLRYNTSPKYICKVPLPNPFLVNQQGKKHGFETEEDGEEYDADLTIVGGKSVEWIVNGIQIRERFKEYQLKENLSKTRPEYYDIIFFNSNKDGFLETLDESIVTQMLSDISEREPENTVENEIKLLLNRIIDRDIKKKNKGKLKQVKEEDTALFENKFALYFCESMFFIEKCVATNDINYIYRVRLMEDINLLLDPMSEGTYISRVLAPILDEFFVKNKDSGMLNAKDKNSQKQDFERRSTGKKIDAFIELREENKVIEVSGPPMKNDWSHYMGDRLKIAKMLKTIINHLVELNPKQDIEITKLTFSVNQSLLAKSTKMIQDFLWSEGGETESFKKMTTRMIHTSTKDTEEAEIQKQEKRNELIFNY